MPWILASFALLLTLSGCGSPQPPARTRTDALQYEIRGEVIRLEPKTNVAVIKHEEIKGWMEAMTMEFPIESEADFRKLKVGDRIRAAVFVKGFDFWVADIISSPGDEAGEQ